MDHFEHDRLDVYKAAIDFLALADVIVELLPKGRAYLADQFRRASTSIPLNIAEGAGEFAAPEKARIYRIARRSGTECAAILDVCRVRNLIEPSLLSAAREVLLRIVAMLTRLILNCGERPST